jgi:hypothetical protein
LSKITQWTHADVPPVIQSSSSIYLLVATADCTLAEIQSLELETRW